MPSWLKKHFRLLKREISEHVWLAKNKNRLAASVKSSGCDITKSPIICNDLKLNRSYSNKNDKNAYRDYTKRCDQVLLYQNNCALRCAQEQKPLNIDSVNRAVSVKKTNNNCDKTASDCCNDECE